MRYGVGFALIAVVVLVTPAWTATPDLDNVTLRDDCNRTEAPISQSGQWTDKVISTNGRQMSANGTVCIRDAGSGTGSTWWNVTTFGPDMAVVALLSDGTTGAGSVLYYYVGLTQPGVANQTDGYRCVFRPGDDDIVLDRVDNSSTTQLQFCSPISAAYGTGDSLACTREGSNLVAYVKRGSVWTAECTFSDSTYTSAGYGGIGAAQDTLHIDNIGIGTLAPTAAAVDAVMPILQ